MKSAHVVPGRNIRNVAERFKEQLFKFKMKILNLHFRKISVATKNSIILGTIVVGSASIMTYITHDLENTNIKSRNQQQKHQLIENQ